ncbi:MAG: chloride channel protein [Syntrophomonadaceae bacterium]|jgi:CIC family chloride channel protein
MNYDSKDPSRRSNNYWLASSRLLLIASMIGIGTGLASIAFKVLIEIINGLFFIQSSRVLKSLLGEYYLILLPALGGLLAGSIVYFWGREKGGYGVSEVMAVVDQDGIMKAGPVWAKTFASAVTIGSGGSAGLHGPIVHIGSSIGSVVGQKFQVSPDILRTLLACGAAGGISATFNAPIGGVLFAQEVILGRFSSSNFILIVISSLISAIISRVYWGDYPSFMVPPYELITPGELLFYLVLGVLAGTLAVIFIKALYSAEDLFKQIPLPNYLKPALGGLLVGLMGVYYPQIFGVGYESVEGILSNDLSWYLVVILMGAKLIATSLTLGSGGLGGVFAPSLYMGSMLGGSYGYLLNQLFPSMTALPGAYALVGMAGVFAGIAQAPITAIIIIFEMTGDYKVVLPLMLVCVISALVARGICPESIYTLKLVREGRDPYKGEKIDKMGQTLVQSVMTSEVETLDINYSLKTAREIMQQRSHTGFPVMSDGRLLGLVTYEQVLSALKRDENSCLREIIKPDLIYVHPQDTIAVVVEKMAEGDVGRLPVVDPEDPGILLGIVSRSDIIEAYSMAAQR